MPIIEIESLDFSYRTASDNALRNINLNAEEGELVVIMGPNEAGKSTLCLTLNGLIPHLVKGTIQGHVKIAGTNTQQVAVRDLFPKVGLVFQDFESQLFSTEVELEVAFAPENLGLSIDEIKQRIYRSLELTGLSDLRGRQPATLSGGQKQLLAIASALSIEPLILCLDEPTTDLDPRNKRRIFDLAHRLFEQRKQTLIVVEHETEEALAADRIVLMKKGRVVADGPAGEILRDLRLLEDCCVMPLQLTELFDKLAVDDLPLTPDEARKVWEKHSFSLTSNAHAKLEEADSRKARSYGAPMIDIKDVHYSYESGIEALRGITLRIREGEFVAILGQNGSGKTTLAKHLNGLLRPTRGEVRIEGVDTNAMSAAELGRQVGYVFQNPDHQIFEENILDEVMFGPRMLGIGQEQAQRQAQDALETVGLWERRDEDPFMLTKGLRQKVAVASVLATRPRAIVMDEPTTGLDYSELQGMMSLVKRLNEEGHTIIIITHCIWIAARYAHRTILMNGGKMVADGPTREVFADEPLLAQADILPPQIVRFSNELGTTMLSVDEFLLYTEMAINLDEDPQDADWPKIARKKRKEENKR